MTPAQDFGPASAALAHLERIDDERPAARFRRNVREATRHGERVTEVIAILGAPDPA